MATTLATLRPNYLIEMVTAGEISEVDFVACFNLIRETSAAAYRASPRGWSGRNKKAEMRDENMRFLLVRSPSDTSDTIESMNRAGGTKYSSGTKPVQGFLSFTLTTEDDVPVVYCYEVHLARSLRGLGVGAMLMQRMEDIGRKAGKEKAMLTVFTSNEPARAFYARLGYYKWADEPVESTRKRTRSSVASNGRSKRLIKPNYCILAKDLLTTGKKKRKTG